MSQSQVNDGDTDLPLFGSEYQFFQNEAPYATCRDIFLGAYPCVITYVPEKSPRLFGCVGANDWTTFLRLSSLLA